MLRARHGGGQRSMSEGPKRSESGAWRQDPKRTVVGKTPQARADELVAWLRGDPAEPGPGLGGLLMGWARANGLAEDSGGRTRVPGATARS